MASRYLVQNPLGVAYLKVIDAVMAVLPRGSARPPRISKLLIGVGGHLGDALISTSALAVIREQLPDVQLGVAAASWAFPAFEGHPAVSWHHRVDHWKVNRSPIGIIGKAGRAMATARAAIREIRTVQYDAAIDVYPYYPNMSVLFARARIPLRVGFEGGGGARLYTSALPWVEDGVHYSARLGALFEQLGTSGIIRSAYDLPPRRAPVDDRILALLTELGVRSAFIVIHPGAGLPGKAWSLDSWIRLAQGLFERDVSVVVTGYGELESHEAARIEDAVPSVINLCGRTTFAELRSVLARAAVVVACDSAAGHVAASEGTPLISIVGDAETARPWRPMSDDMTVHRLSDDPDAVAASVFLRLGRR